MAESNQLYVSMKVVQKMKFFGNKSTAQEFKMAERFPKHSILKIFAQNLSSNNYNKTKNFKPLNGSL